MKQTAMPANFHFLGSACKFAFLKKNVLFFAIIWYTEREQKPDLFFGMITEGRKTDGKEKGSTQGSMPALSEMRRMPAPKYGVFQTIGMETAFNKQIVRRFLQTRANYRDAESCPLSK